mmetsp:Transcript_39748/g.124867  ORF Transcript_39748/g.124867 Transcript_39748/m.124867 type:complete len:418 (+) Transcript_39748:99-1352(+)
MSAMGLDRNRMISSFQEITGWQNVEQCVNCLEVHGWDLDHAVQTALAAHEDERDSTQRVETATERRGGEEVGSRGQARRGLLGFLSSVFGTGNRNVAERRIETEAQKFIDRFNLEHGDVHPTAQTGSFREAVDAAKREFKFLVVYLHAPYHQDTPEFLRDTLCTQVLKDFMDDNFLFWMGSLVDSEAFNVSMLLRASGFPYVAVITTTIDNQTTVCDAHEGLVSREALMNWLMNIMETQGPQLVAQRAEAEERAMDRRIREEQDLAFQQSLLEDQLREREAEEQRKREEEERERALREQQQAEAAARRAEEEAARNEVERLRRKEEKKELFMGPEPTGEGTSLIAIKLPDGSRLQRRFCYTDKVQAIYDFLDAFADIEFDHFDVATNMPKVIYSDRSLSIEDAGLKPQALLFVQESL